MKKRDYHTTIVKPREMILKYQDEIIHPRQAFEILYSGLDTLIESVVESYTSHGRQEKKEARYKSARELEEGYVKWVRSTNKSSYFGLNAEVVFEDNSKRKYILFPRTNFDAEGLKKRPSIIWLRDVNAGESFVLREARRYDLRTFVAPFVRRTYANKFDFEMTTQFYKSIESEKKVDAAKSNGVMFLPEPQLLAGLERMKKEVWMERLTPKPYVLDCDEDNLWYIRRHLSTLVADVSPTIEELGNFYGQMQALGLIEELDRQMIHYGYYKGVIVNYDPDFMVHSIADRLVRQRDFDDLREVMGREAKNLLISFDLIKRAIDQRRELSEQSGITKTTLLEYVPLKVTAEPFAKVGLNER